MHPVHVTSAPMRGRLWPPEWARRVTIYDVQSGRIKFRFCRLRRGGVKTLTSRGRHVWITKFFKGGERGEKLCNSPGYFSLSNERAHLGRSALSFLCALHLPHLTILVLPPLFSYFLSSIFVSLPDVLLFWYIIHFPQFLLL